MDVLVIDVGGTHVKALVSGQQKPRKFNGVVEPMELGHLPYRKHAYEDYFGRHITEGVARLIAALEPEDVVLGGGNVKQLDQLPQECRATATQMLFFGGFRLWEHAPAGKQTAMRHLVPKTITTRKEDYKHANGNRTTR